MASQASMHQLLTITTANTVRPTETGTLICYTNITRGQTALCLLSASLV